MKTGGKLWKVTQKGQGKNEGVDRGMIPYVGRGAPKRCPLFPRLDGGMREKKVPTIGKVIGN